LDFSLQTLLFLAQGLLERHKREMLQNMLWAAKIGDAGSQCALGLAYENGIGVMQSDQEAAVWWRKAAEQGDLSAATSF